MLKDQETRRLGLGVIATGAWAAAAMSTTAAVATPWDEIDLQRADAAPALSIMAVVDGMVETVADMTQAARAHAKLNGAKLRILAEAPSAAEIASAAMNDDPWGPQYVAGAAPSGPMLSAPMGGGVHIVYDFNLDNPLVTGTVREGARDGEDGLISVDPIEWPSITDMSTIDIETGAIAGSTALPDANAREAAWDLPPASRGVGDRPTWAVRDLPSAEQAARDGEALRLDGLAAGEWWRETPPASRGVGDRPTWAVRDLPSAEQAARDAEALRLDGIAAGARLAAAMATMMKAEADSPARFGMAAEPMRIATAVVQRNARMERLDAPVTSSPSFAMTLEMNFGFVAQLGAEYGADFGLDYSAIETATIPKAAPTPISPTQIAPDATVRDAGWELAPSVDAPGHYHRQPVESPFFGVHP